MIKITSKSTEKCHDCGEPATITLTDDFPEKDTGYQSEVSLCSICYKRLCNHLRRIESFKD